MFNRKEGKGKSGARDRGGRGKREKGNNPLAAEGGRKKINNARDAFDRSEMF